MNVALKHCHKGFVMRNSTLPASLGRIRTDGRSLGGYAAKAALTGPTSFGGDALPFSPDISRIERVLGALQRYA